VTARTALIVGAGIGGLSAGIALRQAGWQIRIFERADSPRELGFGVGLAPNAFVALGELGVADTVLSRAYAPRRGELRRPDGTVLKRGELPPGTLGGPLVVALRPALHGALLDAVGADAITLGHEVTGFSTSGSRTALRFADGSAVEGDLVIGADGMGSAIRRTLHPNEGPPRSSGLVAVRGAAHGALEHLDPLSAVYYLGRGIESMFVRASDTGIYWFLSLSTSLLPAGMRDPGTIVSHMAPRFDATFRAITSATEDWRTDELVDRDPIQPWSRGPVTLLGDAAHPVLPHTGQGAAQAITDAVELRNALRSNTDLEAALRAYEDARRTKTAALLRQGRRTAAVMGSTSALVSTARDVAIRLAPLETFAKIFMRINKRAGTDVRARA